MQSDLSLLKLGDNGTCLTKSQILPEFTITEYNFKLSSNWTDLIYCSVAIPLVVTAGLVI